MQYGVNNCKTQIFLFNYIRFVMHNLNIFNYFIRSNDLKLIGLSVNYPVSLPGFHLFPAVFVSNDLVPLYKLLSKKIILFYNLLLCIKLS